MGDYYTTVLYVLWILVEQKSSIHQMYQSFVCISPLYRSEYIGMQYCLTDVLRYLL